MKSFLTTFVVRDGLFRFVVLCLGGLWLRCMVGGGDNFLFCVTLRQTVR